MDSASHVQCQYFLLPEENINVGGYTKLSTIIAIESETNYFKLHGSNHDFKSKLEEWNFMNDKYMFPLHLKSMSHRSEKWFNSRQLYVLDIEKNRIPGHLRLSPKHGTGLHSAQQLSWPFQQLVQMR